MQNHRTGDYIVLSSLSQIFKTCYYVITSPHTVQVGKVTSSQILILETSMIPTKTKKRHSEPARASLSHPFILLCEIQQLLGFFFIANIQR